jgi:aminoglycoside phosphotransferase (APT) family kinase protein
VISLHVRPRTDVEQRVLDLAIEVARRADVDASGADVMRVRQAAHVVLPAADMVVRIEDAGALHLAERQVAVAQALAACHAPVARLVRPEIQPLLVGDRPVTLWRRLRSVADPTYEGIGGAVRALHDATGEMHPAGVSEIDPLEQIRAHLRAPSQWSGSAAMTELVRRTDDLASQWGHAVRPDALGTAIVHGDPHIDNAIVTDDGLVLIDLEDAGIGPAGWDFAPLTLGVKRYGVPPEEVDHFARGYGATPAASPGDQLMCDVYEMLVTAWAIRCGTESATMSAEADVRVGGLLDDDPTLWTML